MIQNRKSGALVLAGLAAFAYYKYTRMTPEERTKLSGTIRDKAKGIFDQILPGGFGNVFAGKGSNNEFANTAGGNSNM